MKEKSRSPPKLSNGRLPLILACLPTTCKNTDSQGCEAYILQDLYGRVGVVQIHPVFEELLHAFDTRPPVQRNEVE